MEGALLALSPGADRLAGYEKPVGQVILAPAFFFPILENGLADRVEGQSYVFFRIPLSGLFRGGKSKHPVPEIRGVAGPDDFFRPGRRLGNVIVSHGEVPPLLPF
jgi:hypothetical protein